MTKKNITGCSDLIRSAAMFVAIAILVMFNVLLCSRVLAPDRTAALLMSAFCPVSIMVVMAFFELLGHRWRGFSVGAIVCVLVLILGAAYSLVLPPFMVPDEGAHFRSVYSLTNALLLRGPDGVMRAEDLYFLESVGSAFVPSGYYGQLRDVFSFTAIDPTLVDTDLVSGYSPLGAKGPQVFLAPATGFMLAQLIGLGTLPMIYLGRLFNLLYFIVLLFFAIRIVPYGKRILAVVALLPITLQQVASLSYDAGILGMSFLLFALILKAITGKGPIRTLNLAGILILSALLAPCKVTYSFITFLALWIPSSRFKTIKQHVIFKLLLFIVPAISVSLTMLNGIFALAVTQGAEEGARGYALSSIFEHPGWFLNLAVNTLYEKADFDLFTMFGWWLGHFQDGLQLPVVYILPFMAIVAIATIRTSSEKVLPRGIRIASVAIYVFVVIAVTITMFLAFTKAGDNTIEGVQGRYFLPVLPLLLFGLQGKTIVAQKDYTYALVYSEALISSFVASINFSIILNL